MAKRQEDYLTLSAILRAREPKMLNKDKAVRMLEAATFEDAAKTLTDCGYEDMSQMNAREIEESLEQHRRDIYAELVKLSPDSAVTDLFRMKYDYHNAKVIIKSEAMGLNAARLMSDAGRVDKNKLKSAYENEDMKELPPELAMAMTEAKSLLARTSNPQQADFVLDRAYFKEFSAGAAAEKNDFLCGYARLMIDAANLKSAVRTMKMGKDAGFLKDALTEGGNVEPARLLAAEDKESLASIFAYTDLSAAAALLGDVVDGGSMTGFELACDNALNKYLQKAKMVSYGSEAVVAYCAALENEMTAVRMILTGRLAKVDPQTIKERLRDLYA